MFTLALIKGVGHHVVSNYIPFGPGIASVARRVIGERWGKQQNKDMLTRIKANGQREGQTGKLISELYFMRASWI